MQGVLQVIQQEKQRFAQEKEDEVNRADQKAEQAARFKGRGGAQQKPVRAAIDEDAD